MANRKRKTRGLLAAHTAELDEPRHGFLIPVRWINNVAGFLLLPLAGILTQTFFEAFSRETLQHAFWRSEEFWFFASGAVAWTITFFILPRPLRVYVFGHELTHAVWVWLMGGRVTAFKVRPEGGYIVTDKSNFWIALAPYFYPIYSMMLLIIYAVAGLFTDVAPYHRLFFGLLGFTWAFHISFTLWMIPKGQTDLSYHGTFFSLVVIYIMNLTVLSILLIVGSHHVTWLGFVRELFHNTIHFSAWVCALTAKWIAGLGPAA